MLAAITQKADELELRTAFHDELELRTAFHAEADLRLSELIASGVGMDWHDMRTNLTARVNRKEPKAPKVRPWRA